MQCPYCKQECSPSTEYCPSCLRKLADDQDRKPCSPNQEAGEWKRPTMLNILKNDWKILLIIIILVLGIPALLSYNTSKKDETAIGQAKLFLADGYVDHEELAEVKWGRVNDAKFLLLKLSDNSKVRKEADILVAEIAAREIGISIVDAQKTIENGVLIGSDIEKAKKIKEGFTYVQSTNRYYQEAKSVLPEFSDLLDIALLTRAKQGIINGKFYEARNDLADISSQSPYAYQAKVVNNELCTAEEITKKREEIRKRKQYANSIADDVFSKSAIHLSVTTSGDTNEYLIIQYKMLSRSLLKKHVDEDKIISTAQELGFKRVTFDTDAGKE
jgi:hypothetical protein